MIKQFIISGILMMMNTFVNAQIGSDTDLHGCIGSAGYTWCHTTETCVREWETPCPDVSYESEVLYLIDEPCPMIICDLPCPNGYIVNDDGCPECQCVLEGYPDNCIYWFDGCNTCSISNGITVMCTMLICESNNNPYCLLYSNGH